MRPGPPPRVRQVQIMGGGWRAFFIIGGLAIAWGIWGLNASLGRLGGGPAMPDVLLWLLTVVLGLFMPVIGYLSQVTLEVHDDHVFASFFPFAKRRIPLDQIDTVRAQQDPNMGVGVRWGPGTGWSYTMGGRGVAFTYSDDRRFFVSSDDPEAVIDAIRALRPELRPDDGADADR